MAAISLRGLTKVYATGVTALDALDLEVENGEFTVLVGPSGRRAVGPSGRRAVGPSGCGKTTALRMVAALERITSGTVSLGGQVVNDVSPRRRDIAMVFQNYALYPHVPVYSNIGFALENAKIPKAERDRRIRAAAGVLGLGDLLGRTPRQLSGGQRQRAAMGRALVREPAVFLMDEPLSNLDAKLRVQMRTEVLRVHRAIGAASLYVTHDQIEAMTMTMGDRVAVLLGGVRPAAVRHAAVAVRPAGQPVRGHVHRLPVDELLREGLSPSDGAGSRPAVVLGSQRLDLPVQVAARVAAYQGRKVVVGIRPEDLVLPAGAGAEAGGTLAADVRLIEVLGSEQRVYFSIDATQAGQTIAGFTS